MNNDNRTCRPDSGAARFDAEETLRLVAKLPAPEGLEERVHAALRSAPRSARILEWPTRFAAEAAWVRSAAAAAIAFVVVGGGWGIYSRVQTAKVIVMPSHIAAPGSGFSNAGARRTPQTLNGPAVPHAQPEPHMMQMPAKPGQSTQQVNPANAPVVK
jgi:hypothetical protein